MYPFYPFRGEGGRRKRTMGPFLPFLHGGFPIARLFLALQCYALFHFFLVIWTQSITTTTHRVFRARGLQQNIKDALTSGLSTMFKLFLVWPFRVEEYFELESVMLCQHHCGIYPVSYLMCGPHMQQMYNKQEFFPLSLQNCKQVAESVLSSLRRKRGGLHVALTGCVVVVVLCDTVTSGRACGCVVVVVLTQ